MTKKTILITSIISMTLLIGLTANFAIADDDDVDAEVEIIEGTITDADGDTQFWEFEDTDGTSTLTVTHVCGNTDNTSEELDPILTVISPSITRDNDDSFTPCDNFNSSIVNYAAGEAEDGCWETNPRGFQGLGDETGPYTLTLTLLGPGEIDQVESCDDDDDDDD